MKTTIAPFSPPRVYFGQNDRQQPSEPTGTPKDPFDIPPLSALIEQLQGPLQEGERLRLVNQQRKAELVGLLNRLKAQNPDLASTVDQVIEQLQDSSATTPETGRPAWLETLQGTVEQHRRQQKRRRMFLA
jgi:hypothetical protein